MKSFWQNLGFENWRWAMKMWTTTAQMSMKTFMLISQTGKLDLVGQYSSSAPCIILVLTSKIIHLSFKNSVLAWLNKALLVTHFIATVFTFYSRVRLWYSTSWKDPNILLQCLQNSPSRRIDSMKISTYSLGSPQAGAAFAAQSLWNFCLKSQK